MPIMQGRGQRRRDLGTPPKRPAGGMRSPAEQLGKEFRRLQGAPAPLRSRRPKGPSRET